MPTYVYACDTCRVEFEKFQSFKDDPLRTCPTCDGAVRRVLQPAGIVFKGSGWHITDYRAQSGGGSSTSESTTNTSTSAADGGASSAPAAESTASSAPATAPAPSTGSDSTAS